MELFLPEPQPENSLNTITEFMTGLCWFVSQCSDHGPLLSDVQCPRATISYVLSVWSCYGQKSKSVSCHSVLKRNRSPIYVVNFRAFFLMIWHYFLSLRKWNPCLAWSFWSLTSCRLLQVAVRMSRQRDCSPSRSPCSEETHSGLGAQHLSDWTSAWHPHYPKWTWHE